MVILNLELNHILAFNDFIVNFSYPRKLNRSAIENENLQDIPSFRYKKLNLFIGSNATGKTSLMRCIASILRFMAKREKEAIKDIVNESFDESEAVIDFVDKRDKKNFLHRFKIKTSGNGRPDFNVYTSHAFLELKLGDSYEKSVSTLESVPDHFQPYLYQEDLFSSSWNMVLPATEENYDQIVFEKTTNAEEDKDYTRILNAILKTLDPSIQEATKSLDTNDAYVIHHENDNRIIVQAGNRVTEIRRLSSGTKYGINLANIVFAIKYHRNGIYLVDEQFSYISSDIEIALLNVMMELLGDDEQIFFTTHNQNILSLGLPFHSFYFLRKEMDGDKKMIRVSCASDLENRNNVSPLNMYENDMFGSAPNLGRIYDILKNTDEEVCQ